MALEEAMLSSLGRSLWTLTRYSVNELALVSCDSHHTCRLCVKEGLSTVSRLFLNSLGVITELVERESPLFVPLLRGSSCRYVGEAKGLRRLHYSKRQK